MLLLENLIPKKLLLQLDNTTKQNKSKFLFGYLAFLLLRGTFDHVLVSFLPVGHTHEDIDQMFSRFSVKLRSMDALSRTQLGEVIAEVFVFF
jgi:hypothetical protein